MTKRIIKITENQYNIIRNPKIPRKVLVTESQYKLITEEFKKAAIYDVKGKLYKHFIKAAEELKQTASETGEVGFNGDLFEVLYDDTTKDLIGATWLEPTSGVFASRIVIKDEYRGKGLSDILFKGLIDKYIRMRSMRGPEYKFMANVVNPNIVGKMEKMGFKKESEENGHVTMIYQG